MNSNEFKKFWDTMVTPSHAHASDKWFDRYAREILSYISGARTVVDAGCGSGEILVRIAPYCDKITGIDYSQSMLSRASEKVSSAGYAHVKLFCDNIINLDRYCRDPVDAIYCNGVVQYLSPAEMQTFLTRCKNILKADGKLIVLNIPNINSRILFMLGYYKHEKKISFFHVLNGLPRLWWKMMLFKVRNKWRNYDDGVGNWFSIEQIREVARLNDLNVAIYGASVVNYYYRFHAVFTLK